MELASKYDPRVMESKRYQYWLNDKLFSSKPDGRESYTMVIPPPNVAGVLRMGHMLNNTIQDILVRRARTEDKNACQVPDTDHASIVIETKVANRLVEQGVKKTDLIRGQFLKHVWGWTHEHGGITLKQLCRLDCLCDWDRIVSTVDDTRSRSVVKVFYDLYKKGYIYRGVCTVNWDPQAQTTLSDEEVIYRDGYFEFYRLKCYVAEEDQAKVERKGEGSVMCKDMKGYYVVVATTRPETIIDDSATCVDPEDVRNTWSKGPHVIVPLVNRVISVIEGTYVDTQLGTNCLKVTPVHDANDHALGLKHGLETIDIFSDSDTISEATGLYTDQDRMNVCKQISKDSGVAGLMKKVEDYDNKVGYSERTHTPIEPELSIQWFLKMQHFVDIVPSPVMDDDIESYPRKYKNTYRHWLESIKDQCISRQLWRDHRVPAYYFKDAEDKSATAMTETTEEALKLTQEINPSVTAAGLGQESDCIDTWFSSWPQSISALDGVNSPDNEEINYYHPVSDPVTDPDIIFFWVTHMIMAGYGYRGRFPPKHVYFTGTVRDKLGHKVSKSLGNSPDPVMLIERYGADSVRIGTMLSALISNDALFNETLCEQGRNLNSKVWNVFRLAQGWKTTDAEQPLVNKIAIEWFETRLKEVDAEMNEQFKNCHTPEALMTAYRLFRGELLDRYLEITKPEYGKPISKLTYRAILKFLNSLLKTLYPFMPFIAEELWQYIYEHKDNKNIMHDRLRLGVPSKEGLRLIEAIEQIKAIVGGVRAIRNQENITPKVEFDLNVIGQNSYEACSSVVVKMASLKAVEMVTEKSGDTSGLMAGTDSFAIPVGDLIGVAAEVGRQEKEFKHPEGLLTGIKKKLSNEKFVVNASEVVIEREREKQSGSEEKIIALKVSFKESRKE